MQRAIDETERRRALQKEYNKKHGITPETVRKNIAKGIEQEAAAHEKAATAISRDEEQLVSMEMINALEAEMLDAAGALQFERAAIIRDRIEELRKNLGKRMNLIDFKKQDAGPKGKRGRTSRKPGGRVPKPER